ncbi:MAG: hypothetical protein KGJ13_02655 [Patescibacteria group bacterium]|nr:hypothetical protein [Patescibacteria group bacterium]
MRIFKFLAAGSFILILAVIGLFWLRAHAPSAPAKTPPIAPTNSMLGAAWQAVPQNPVITGGSCFSWRCAGVTDPALIQNQDGTAAIWFTTIGIYDVGGQYASSGPYLGRAVGSISPFETFAVSPDQPVTSVGATGTWDRYIETPSVRRLNGSLAMWYLGYAESGFKSPALGEMHAADSAGTAWILPPDPIYRPQPGNWDGTLVTGPTVVRGPDGLWRLYYSGIGTKNGIGLLTSPDGTHWKASAANPVFLNEPGKWDDEILEQAVIYARGQYWMWYSGWRGTLQPSTPISIGLATSSDGIHWSRYAGNPVIVPGPPGSWDDLRVLAPDVIVRPDGSFLMAAYGSSRADEGRSAGSIGLWESDAN